MLDIEGGIERAVIIFIEFGKIEIFFLGKDESIGVEIKVIMEMIWWICILLWFCVYCVRLKVYGYCLFLLFYYFCKV